VSTRRRGHTDCWTSHWPAQRARQRPKESGQVSAAALRWYWARGGDAEVLRWCRCCFEIAGAKPSPHPCRPTCLAQKSSCWAQHLRNFIASSSRSSLTTTTTRPKANRRTSAHIAPIAPGGPTATMGVQKKEASRKERQNQTGDGMGNVKERTQIQGAL
jgi:hypothetical protein